MGKLSDRADFEVKWHPFQLNSAAKGGKGVNKMAMYKEKFGEERMAQMLPRMIETGKQDGINFSYGGNTGNTYDSHRLIALAAREGKQDAIVEELFRNYFEQEKCISDSEVLLAAAKKVGITNAEEALAGRIKEVDAEVDAELRKFQGSMGISGVPYFIIDGKYGESGALESRMLQEIFKKVLCEK
mmetsp:Transcript_13435/g.28057  ORF Transcript_13435/g.28057 Transcript_13435/m.28057 type:complete len:186 (-) Transcript_13435:97-654(-)